MVASTRSQLRIPANLGVRGVIDKSDQGERGALGPRAT